VTVSVFPQPKHNQNHATINSTPNDAAIIPMTNNLNNAVMIPPTNPALPINTLRKTTLKDDSLNLPAMKDATPNDATQLPPDHEQCYNKSTDREQ
jgi:hypothetical protein